MITSDEFKRAIGQRIRQLRADLSQDDFARELGTVRGYIGDIERGRTKPSLELLLSLAVKYGVSIDWIVTGKEQPLALSKPFQDPELETMIDALRGFWRESDEEKRTWLKLQFWAALPLVTEWYTKKRHEREEAASGA